MSWTFWGELLSVASAGCMALPAWSLNKHLRDINQSQSNLVTRTTTLAQAIARQVSPSLEAAKLPEWSRRDQRLLLAGLGLFALSSLIKLGVAWTTP